MHFDLNALTRSTPSTRKADNCSLSEVKDYKAIEAQTQGASTDVARTHVSFSIKAVRRISSSQLRGGKLYMHYQLWLCDKTAHRALFAAA